MFSIPRANVVESDSGFSVEVLGRTGLLYVENGRSLRIDSEALAGPSGMVVYARSINEWLCRHSAEHIDDAAKARIIENCRAAFKFRGFDIQVVWQ